MLNTLSHFPDTKQYIYGTAYVFGKLIVAMRYDGYMSTIRCVTHKSAIRFAKSKFPNMNLVEL